MHSGMGEGLGSAKERKLMDCDTDSLISERKGGGGGNAKAHHLPQADWCPASLQAMTTLEENTHSVIFFC